MKRTIIVAIVISLLLVILPVSLALAQSDSDVVTVTATPGTVSISTSGTYDFGSVGLSSTPDTSGSPLTITNSSSLVVDISIGCNGWSGGATPWTYGAAGADTALLNASASDGGSGGSTGVTDFDKEVPSTGSILLINDLAVGTSPTWNLQLEAPTSFSIFDEQTTTVTLTTVVGG
jgi:hypothetical protein